MRILCLTPRIPYPPDRGDRLRAYNFIKHLSQEHSLTLLSFIAAADRRQYVEPLKDFCEEVEVVQQSQARSWMSVGMNLWRDQPLQSLYYRSGRMQERVERILESREFDAAYIHLFRMAPYLQKHPELYRVVDLTDVISREIAVSLPFRSRLWRAIYAFELPRIRRFERLVADHFDESWLISEADRHLLSGLCPQANIRLIPNGVDFERFTPTREAEEFELLFTGHMRVFHNVDAANYLAREILPAVQESLPGCRLQLAGSNPAPEVLKLSEIQGVLVPGYVADLNGLLNKASIFVAPLRFAAGVQNKVLEAMAAGRPVITTSIVNEGLGAEAGRDLIVADDPGEFAAQIIDLLADRQKREKIGAAGLSFVRHHFSWQIALDRMNAIETMLGKRAVG